MLNQMDLLKSCAYHWLQSANLEAFTLLHVMPLEMCKMGTTEFMKHVKTTFIILAFFTLPIIFSHYNQNIFQFYVCN